MKQQKEHWVKTLFSFAGPCKGKMTLSVLCAILSVAGGFVPFWAVYEILLLFINRTATLNNILLWCLVGVGGYLIRVICFGISTILAHISAYTILEGIRLKIANRLMRAPLGEVMGRRIGYLKNIIMDKVEDLEPPLAHMIPELTSNLLLPVAIFIWLLAIDWRLGLAVLIAPVLAMIPMFFLMRNYNSQYAAYMEANNHVNNVIIEYVEGIEVVKAFNQSTSSYEKFVGAVKSFKDFTLAWFKSTWKTMNLMMAIMPTTLLGVLPIGLLLTQSGSITPAELAMGIILSLSIVGPLMKAICDCRLRRLFQRQRERLPAFHDGGESLGTLWRGYLPCTPSTRQMCSRGWGACPAPCGFLVSKSTSSPTSRSAGQTASISLWGRRRPRPAIQS